MPKVLENSSKLLIDEPPLQALPSLAKEVGLNEAIILQQVHYWLRTFRISEKKDHFREGRWWVYNSYNGWKENFPFWGTGSIRRAIRNLEKKGLLISSEFNASKGNRTKWYSIDYKSLDKLCKKSKITKDLNPSVGNSRPSVTDDKSSDQSEQLIKNQRLASETTSDIDSLPSSQEQKKSSKPKTQYIQNMEHLEMVFAKERGVPPPDWNGRCGSGLQKSWRTPVKNLLKLCDGSMDQAEQLIKLAVKKMIDDEMTLVDPRGVEKVAISIYADMNLRRRSRKLSATERRIAAERAAKGAD